MKKLVKIRLINWHYLSNETINIKGNTLLTGANATGKSTILDAITYVLTAGDTQFNLAANDKGKRDLRGYVKCKLGTDEREYLRDGDVVGDIALEFYDEKNKKSFTVGTVIDAFGDLAPVKSIFYYAPQAIDDSMFTDGKTIYSTVDFRKNNPSFEYYLVKKEAKKAFRNWFGSINEDFFRLIPKALAFKPIPDVKDFIYQNILEEKPIDVSAIKDAVRSYKELEVTLKQIQAKINDLHEIDNVYQEIVKIEDDKAFIDYLMHLVDVESLKNEINEHNADIERYEDEKNAKEKEIRDLDADLQSLQERSRELYNLLSNNDVFKADEYINREILKTTSNISNLEANLENYVRRCSNFKDIIQKLRTANSNPIFGEIANLNLNSTDSMVVEDNKIKLKDFASRVQTIKNKLNQEYGALDNKKSELRNQIDEISHALRDLSQNKVNFPSALIGLRNDIKEGLKRIYNYDVNVHILAELCEITNPDWADTVEIFLGNRRFNLVVEPRYFDQALQIYSRIKDRYRLYGIGLVNTKQIAKYTSYSPKSLASIIECENKDARAYINYTCGNVIMCKDAMELENYPTSITNDLLIYRGYAVTSLNPNVDRPFMGKGAASKASAIWNDKAIKAKNDYLDLTEKMNNLNAQIELIDRLDTQPVIDNLSLASKLKSEKEALSDLERQAVRQKSATPSELQDDYNKVLATISNCDEKKISVSKEIGSINSTIDNLKEAIKEKSLKLDDLNKELKELANGNIVIEEKAKNEYESLVQNKNMKLAIQNYEENYKALNGSFTTLCDSLTEKQFKYITTYESPLSIGLTEIDKFLQEMTKLEKSELVKYEQKVRDAREAAELVFREDFIAKLRNNILTAEQEISRINETLENITFGNDKYQFIFPRSSEYASFYDMVTSDLVDIQQGLFTYDFQSKYNNQISELFESLSVDELNSNGAFNKFTDYRTYMDYDIQIKNADGETMTYSKVAREKSGGETQVPFYVAIIASFVRVYTKNGYSNSDPIGIVMFDEVFDKMDPARMRAMMNFIASMPLQVIIACPPQRMDILADYTDTILLMVRPDKKAFVREITKKDITGGNISDGDIQ